MPDPSGSRTSITTRSGWKRRACVDAPRRRCRPRRRPGSPGAGRASRRGPGGRPRGRRRPGGAATSAGRRSVMRRAPRSVWWPVGRVSGSDRRPSSRRVALRWSIVAPMRAARDRACWPGPDGRASRDRRRIEPAPVVLDGELAGPSVVVEPDDRPRCPEWRATLLSASLTMPSRWRWRRVGLASSGAGVAARRRSSSCGGTPRRSRPARRSGSSRSGAPGAGRR